MDTSIHSLETLFQQLGLPADEAAVAEFISNHRLSHDVPLDKAPFWNRIQAAFIREAIDMDADWSGVVDKLDTQLRRFD